MWICVETNYFIQSVSYNELGCQTHKNLIFLRYREVGSFVSVPQADVAVASQCA